MMAKHAFHAPVILAAIVAAAVVAGSRLAMTKLCVSVAILLWSFEGGTSRRGCNDQKLRSPERTQRYERLGYCHIRKPGDGLDSLEVVDGVLDCRHIIHITCSSADSRLVPAAQVQPARST